MATARKQRHQFIDLIRTFHDLDGDFDAWALRVISAARPYMDDGGGVGLRVIDAASPWHAKLVSVVWPGDPQAIERWSMLGRLVPPGWVHHLYRTGVDVFLSSERVTSLFKPAAFDVVRSVFSGPTTLAQWRSGQSIFWRATRTDAQTAEETSAQGDEATERTAAAVVSGADRPLLIASQPAADLMMVNVADIDRQVLSLTASQRALRPLCRADQARWRHAGSHLLSAWRLRRHFSEHAPDAQTAKARCAYLLNTPDVVWDAADGKVLHVNAPARLTSAPPSGSDVRARAAWLAIQQGRWTIIETVDADGRRFLVARDLGILTDPQALSVREQQVLIGVSGGMSNRDLADQLNLSVSTIGTHLLNVMHKLGIGRRADLIGWPHAPRSINP